MIPTITPEVKRELRTLKVRRDYGIEINRDETAKLPAYLSVWTIKKLAKVGPRGGIQEEATYTAIIRELQPGSYVPNSCTCPSPEEFCKHCRAVCDDLAGNPIFSDSAIMLKAELLKQYDSVSIESDTARHAQCSRCPAPSCRLVIVYVKRDDYSGYLKFEACDTCEEWVPAT